jgi:hypothetical protein
MATKPKLTTAQRKARNLRRTAGSTFYITAGVTAAANAYASEHTPIGITIGLWTPLAFFLSLELLERIPARRGSAMSWVRTAGIGFLALIAGWVSYWHLVEVLASGGVTDPVAKYLMPLTVDVLMAIARGAMHAKASPTLSSRRKPQASNVRQLRRKTA